MKKINQIYQATIYRQNILSNCNASLKSCASNIEKKEMYNSCSLAHVNSVLKIEYQTMSKVFCYVRLNFHDVTLVIFMKHSPPFPCPLCNKKSSAFIQCENEECFNNRTFG